MYPIPPTEKLVETRQCRHCQADFPITDKDLEFYDKVSPKFGDVKYNIPAPTLCPDCRQQRRLSWRNERKLYKRKCDATGKEIISNYSPDKPFRIFNQEYWWGNQWDAMDYGRPYDFARPFFQQFGELMHEVPKQSISGFGNSNCDFTNYLWNCKDRYLSFAGVENENVLYSYWISSCKDTVDSSLCQKSEILYSSLECINCFECFYCKDCTDCQYCYYSEWLIGKSYYWKNEPSSPLEIAKLLQQESTTADFLKNDKRALRIIGSEESTGNNLTNCYRCHTCFDLEDSKYCSFWTFWFNMSECRDFDYDSGSELAYQCHTGYRNKISGFLSYGNELSDSYYCGDCFTSSYLFGCVGLRDKKYCILNKQYTQSEYEELVPRIIEHMKTTGEWGEFFPSSLSPFGYNETVANEYFPMSREAALARGFNWSDYEAPFPKVEKIIPAAKLPDDIAAVPDDILNWAIECEVTGKPFRIIKPELEFYRKHGLPIPHKHPDQRHLDRIALRNPRKLFDKV